MKVSFIHTGFFKEIGNADFKVRYYKSNLEISNIELLKEVVYFEKYYYFNNYYLN